MSTPALVRRFLTYTFAWAIVLAGLTSVYNVINAPSVNLRPGGLLTLAVGLFGLFVTFASFAGGVAVSAVSDEARRLRPTILGGLTAAAVAFVFLAYVDPVADYRELSLRFDEERVAELAPFGPDTPGNRLEQLRYLAANQPDSVSFSVDAPLRQPGNWVRYLFHLSFVVPLLAVIYGVIGHAVGLLTHPISPSRRRHARWVAGLASAFVFITPVTYTGAYVRSSVDVPGALSAWALLVPPLILAVALHFLVRTKDQGAPGEHEVGGSLRG